MICPKCGTENKDTFNNYCVYCGAYLGDRNAPLEEINNKDEGASFKVFLIILFAFIAFGGSLILGRLLKSKEEGIGIGETYINIPYALDDIKPGIKITKEMTGTVEVKSTLIDKVSFLYNDNSLFDNNLCVKEDNKVIKGSYFYIDQLEKCSTSNKYETINIKVDNNTYKYMKRNLYVDLYVKIDNKTRGRVFQALRVMDAYDNTIDILIPNEYEELMNKVKNKEEIELKPILVKRETNMGINPVDNVDILQELKRMVD